QSLITKNEPKLFTQEIEGSFFRFYSNHTINEKNHQIKRLIFAIQGNKRDAAARMRIMQNLLEELKIAHETLVISPCFKIPSDDLLPNEPYWKNAGWKQGDRSKDKSRVSSFTVIDELITRALASGNFPSL